MKIIEPEVELWKQEDFDAHIARCARVCYKSTAKNNDSDKLLIQNLKKLKHYSVFRHGTLYAIVNCNEHPEIFKALRGYERSPYIKWVTLDNCFVYIVTNGNFHIDIAETNPELYELLTKHIVSPEKFLEYPFAKEMMRYTFKVVTQISTSRELNRTSPNNISEQSTRYVLNDTICRPHWLPEKVADWLNDDSEKFHSFILEIMLNRKAKLYVESCEHAFKVYNELANYYMDRQDARGVLPLDTATTCVYTYSIEEWRNIINLRYYGTTGAPHPNAKIIAGKIRYELIALGYDFNEPTLNKNNYDTTSK